MIAVIGQKIKKKPLVERVQFPECQQTCRRVEIMGVKDCINCQSYKERTGMKQIKTKFGWHYGVIRKTRRVNKITCHYYEIHEIYPLAKGQYMWTEDPITPYGETVNELGATLSRMLIDLFYYPVYEIRNGKLIKRKG